AASSFTASSGSAVMETRRLAAVMAERQQKLTATRVRELLDYDPDSGWLTWRTPRNGTRIGARAGSLKSDGYRRIKIDGTNYAEHRVIWLLVTGRWPDRDIDHIDGRRDDNRIAFLRDCSKSENVRNRGGMVADWRLENRARRVRDASAVQL